MNRADLIKQAEAKFSRDQLVAQAEAKFKADSEPGPVSDPSDGPAEPSLGQRVGRGLLHGVSSVASKIDSYGGAPTRSALGALQEGKGLLGAAKSFGHQFGASPEQAPTGKELAQKAGLSSEESLDTHLPYIGKVSPAGAAGLAVDVLADPLNLVPFGEAAKLGAKGIEGARALAKPAIKAAEAVGEGAKSLGTKVLSKAGEALTGIPKKEIETYTTHLKEINDRIKRYGGEIATASDDVRTKFASDIAAKRKELNAQISKTLEESSPKKNVVLKEVIDSLEKAKSKLNPNYHKSDISQIDEMIASVKQEAKGGKATLRGAFDTKQFLQDMAQGSYQKAGQIFMPGKQAQRAAKDAGAIARRIVNKHAPELAEANNQLAVMRKIEGDINKNVIAPGKSEAALMGAGASQGGRQRKNLERLGQAVGQDFVGEADKLAAQRAFTSPGITPVDTTGKSMLRYQLGRAGIGAGAGYLADGKEGAILGAVVSSPLALKAAINSGAISASAIHALTGTAGKLTDASIKKAFDVLRGPNGGKILRGLYTGGEALQRNETNKRRGLLP